MTRAELQAKYGPRKVVRYSHVEVLDHEACPLLAKGRHLCFVTPIDHPLQHLNGNHCKTSTVIQVDGDVVVTANTIYVPEGYAK